MRISIIGAGYVGIVSGASFADFGHDVTCVEKDSARVEALKIGVIPIYEPGLEALVKKNINENRLSFTTDLISGIKDRDVIFIAVGTPARRGDGHADLTHVYEAAREIAQSINKTVTIVMKSTVPVGTSDKVEKILREIRPDLDLKVVSNPEFLREGAAIGDFKRPDRIVIGTEDAEARHIMREIYRPLFLNEPPFVFTDRRTSELIKYAANSFLAVKITFINEIADLCERMNANVQDVARGIGLDNRIGSKFLHPGPGFGGSCFPKDMQALSKTAYDAQMPLRLVETAIASNNARKSSIAQKVIAACGGSVRNLNIAILGLAFKPNTDDMREAPSISIINMLQNEGAQISAYDPEAMDQARNILNDVKFENDAYSCARGADAIVIVTEWDMFRALDLVRIRSLMKNPVIVDLRNIYMPSEVRKFGFEYSSVGRP